jgi:hypothetical protein
MKFQFAVCSLVLLGVSMLGFIACQDFAAQKPVGHYAVDETANYFAWYFVDTLQDSIRTELQRR